MAGSGRALVGLGGSPRADLQQAGEGRLAFETRAANIRVDHPGTLETVEEQVITLAGAELADAVVAFGIDLDAMALAVVQGARLDPFARRRHAAGLPAPGRRSPRRGGLREEDEEEVESAEDPEDRVLALHGDSFD